MLWVPRMLPLALAVVAVVAISSWWGARSPQADLRLPGSDRPAGGIVAPRVDLAGKLIVGTASPGAGQSAWPSFRGDGTNRATDTELLKDLSGAQVLWQVAVGDGYAGPAVHGGRVYLLDYADGGDALRCLSTDTGAELWRHTYQVDVKRNHGMSRTIPAVEAGVVITLGPQCHVVAVDAENGRFLWGKDLVREYGTRVPPWYAGQCPIVRDGRVYLAPAGDQVLLTALDAKTGEMIWEVPNPNQWKMTHSSLLEVALPGTDPPETALVYCASGGVIGVDKQTGKVLWESTEWKVSIATVPSPLDLGAGRILFTGGYGAGAMIGRVERKGDEFKLVVEKRMPPAVMGSEQQTPILLPGGSAFLAVIPSGEMVCMGLDGVVQWRSGSTRFGSAPYLLADNTVYALNDTGKLSSLAATEGRFNVLSTKKVFEDGQECWGPMALADGRLYLRDLTRLVCVDLKAK